MASLSGFTPASTFQSLIKTVNNLAITGSSQLSDGNGNTLAISLSATDVSVNGPLTASIVSATSNGLGTNFKVGDDVWIGDVNLSNTALISGQQDSTQGFFKFGNTATSPILGAASSSILQLSGSLLISGSLTVGSGSIGVGENTLVLGPASAGGAGEGGQMLLSAKGGGYDSASMWDNYQNSTRLLRGSNAGSDAPIASFNMHTGQFALAKYTGSATFPGTAVASLGVDSGGNVITTNSISGYTPTAYLSAYHTASLVVPVANTPYTMSYSTTDFSLGGISISGSYSDKIKVSNTGIYNIQFSAQTSKTTGTTSNVNIWLAKNGTDIPYSNTGVTLAGGANDVAIPAWNFYVSASAGDYYQLKFAATATNTLIEYLASGSVGLNGPAVPSVILTVNRVG